MKILVPIKRVPDSDTRVRVRADAGGIETDGVKFAVNPFDAIALEEAVRIKERFADVEIIGISIGTDECVEQLRLALAMGADRAILVQAAQDWDSLGVAKVLGAIYERERPNLILMGKQAIDDDSNQTGQMLAGVLRLPQATFVSKIEILENWEGARCSRETDAGIETIEVPFPAVITADLRLNEPRYVSLPNIIKAKRKPLEQVLLADLGLKVAPRSAILKLEPPPKRRAGVRVKTVDEMLAKLRDEAKVI